MKKLFVLSLLLVFGFFGCDSETDFSTNVNPVANKAKEYEIIDGKKVEVIYIDGVDSPISKEIKVNKKDNINSSICPDGVSVSKRYYYKWNASNAMIVEFEVLYTGGVYSNVAYAGFGEYYTYPVTEKLKLKCISVKTPPSEVTGGLMGTARITYLEYASQAPCSNLKYVKNTNSRLFTPNSPIILVPYADENYIGLKAYYVKLRLQCGYSSSTMKQSPLLVFRP